jgi:hypothetical protein
MYHKNRFVFFFKKGGGVGSSKHYTIPKQQWCIKRASTVGFSCLIYVVELIRKKLMSLMLNFRRFEASKPALNLVGLSPSASWIVHYKFDIVTKFLSMIQQALSFSVFV